MKKNCYFVSAIFLFIVSTSSYSQSIDSTFIKNKTFPKYFNITGLSLTDNSVYECIKEVFLNPRNYLKEVPEENWMNSEIYLRYFEPYDKSSKYRIKNEDDSDEEDTDIEDQIDALRKSRTSGNIIQNYEDFPLPETIDLEVNVKDWSLKMLDIDFDINKLNSNFRKLLFELGTNNDYKNQRSIISKSE